MLPIPSCTFVLSGCFWYVSNNLPVSLVLGKSWVWGRKENQEELVALTVRWKPLWVWKDLSPSTSVLFPYYFFRSNCVINLVPDKEQVLREVYDTLKVREKEMAGLKTPERAGRITHSSATKNSNSRFIKKEPGWPWWRIRGSSPLQCREFKANLNCMWCWFNKKVHKMGGVKWCWWSILARAYFFLSGNRSLTVKISAFDPIAPGYYWLWLAGDTCRVTGTCWVTLKSPQEFAFPQTDPAFPWYYFWYLTFENSKMDVFYGGLFRRETSICSPASLPMKGFVS